jgi:hypothetical protein
MKFPAVRACEQILEITIHTATDQLPFSSLQCDACEQMLQITNHTASRTSSMQFPVVRCVRADSTDH